MTLSARESNALKMNGAMDIAKLVMAILVIGMHTEPFGFSFWLNKGFSICRRLCVPFFFTASGYFFWRKENSLKKYLQRIAILYVVWSVIYLPFDIPELRQMTLPELLRRFLWDGNKNALWYLWATIVGFIITSVFLRFLKPKYVLITALVFLIVGALKTTYSTAVYQLFGIRLPDYLGTRNGLFYGFPYIALGMAVAKSAAQGVFRGKRRKIYAGFFISLLLLVAESYLFDMRFKAESNLIKLSVLPYTYFFFEIVLNTKILLDKSLSLTIRKMSTLMYVSQFLFIPVLSNYSSYMLLFILTALAAAVFSLVIIKLSEKKALWFLRYLY